MIPAIAYAVSEAGDKFALYKFERRQPVADDVLIRIHYCGKFNLKTITLEKCLLNFVSIILGICHTDIHFANNDFGISQYPLVRKEFYTTDAKRVLCFCI
jgi:uncharacterized zinc-type alcohol dehydrogenase-like protein